MPKMPDTQATFNSLVGNMVPTNLKPNCSLQQLQELLDYGKKKGWQMSVIVRTRVEKFFYLNNSVEVKHEVINEKNETRVHPREFDALVAAKYASKFRNALERNIEFDLSFSEMKKLVRSRTCYYSGVKLDITTPSLPNSWTIDRIDNTKGYVKGNVVACSYEVNNWKSIAIESKKHNVSLNTMIKVLEEIRCLK